MLKACPLEACVGKVLYEDVGVTGTSEQYSYQSGK